MNSKTLSLGLFSALVAGMFFVTGCNSEVSTSTTTTSTTSTTETTEVEEINPLVGSTYTNTAYDYSLTMPEGWELELDYDDYGDDIGVTAYNPFDNYDSYLTISIFSDDIYEMTEDELKAYYEEGRDTYLDILREDYADLELVESEFTEIDGLTVIYYQIKYYDRVYEETFIESYYDIIRDNVSWSTWLATTEVAYEAAMKEFEATVASMKF